MEHNCYIDTRGNVKTPLSFTEALVKGLAQGGGLFVPQNLPSFGLMRSSRWSIFRMRSALRRSTRHSIPILTMRRSSA